MARFSSGLIEYLSRMLTHPNNIVDTNDGNALFIWYWVGAGGGGETIFAEQTLSSAQLLLNHMMIHMTNNDMNRWW